MKIVTAVGYLLVIFGLSFLVWVLIIKSALGLELFLALVSFGMAVIAIGLSFVGLGTSTSSDEKMVALTNLNYYEKMAMLEGYKAMYPKDETDRKTRIANKADYDIKAISELDPFLDDDKKINARDNSKEELFRDYLEQSK
jgi:hypothetical protein